MIDKSKQYRTRNGREVRIYATDGYGKKPVHGAYWEGDEKGGWIDYAWAITGASYLYGDGEPLDLIEVRPRIKRTVWLNIDIDDTVSGFFSKEEAESYAYDDRLACVRVEIDCEEGTGL